jgi:hypothetical protein
MRSTAVAYKDEYDEVPVSSQELLEANVGAIRVDLNELKTDFRAAVKRIDERIDAAVTKLEAEIRVMAAKAADDIRQLSLDMREMRAEDKSVRDKAEKNFEAVNTKIDKVHESLSAKIDKATARMDATDATVAGLDKKFDGLQVRLAALLWLVGIVGAGVPIVIAVGNALHWF